MAGVMAKRAKAPAVVRRVRLPHRTVVRLPPQGDEAERCYSAIRAVVGSSLELARQLETTRSCVCKNRSLACAVQHLQLEPLRHHLVVFAQKARWRCIALSSNSSFEIAFVVVIIAIFPMREGTDRFFDVKS